MKILREFYFADWRCFVVCGNKFLRFDWDDWNFSWELIFAVLCSRSRNAAHSIFNLYCTVSWVTFHSTYILETNHCNTLVCNRNWIAVHLTFSVLYMLFSWRYRLPYVSKLGLLFPMGNHVNILVKSNVYRPSSTSLLKTLFLHFCGVLFCGFFILRELIFAIEVNPHNRQK